jgi:hypothetical protein
VRRDNSVGIATGYGLDGRSLNPGRGKICLLSIPPKPALRPFQALIQWLPVALSPEVKRSGREARSRIVELYLHFSIHIHGGVHKDHLVVSYLLCINSVSGYYRPGYLYMYRC